MKVFRGMREDKRYPVWPAALVLLVMAMAMAVAAPSWLPAAEKETAVLPGGSVKEVKVSRTPYYTNIEAVVDGKIESYNSFKLNDPFRIIIDVWGVSKGAAASEIAVDTPEVKSVKLSQHENKLRILVETPEDRPLPFLVTTEGQKLVLSVGGGTEEKVTSRDRLEEGKPAAKGPAVVGIDLEDLPQASNVVVATSGAISYSYQIQKKESSITLLFPGASMEKGLLRAIEARKLEIPVKRIVPSLIMKGVSVTVAFAPGSSYTVEKRGDAVVVSFPKKAAAGPEPTVVARMTETKAPAAPQGRPAAVGEKGSGPAEGSQQWGFAIQGAESQRRYVGQRISLDFKDADLTNVFRIIAEVSNLNIIASDDVKGRVTLRLVNVPWDQALDLVLQSKSLGVRQEGNVLRIAPLTALRSEEKARLDSQKEVEKLKATLEAEIETIPVSYSKASDLQAKIKDLLSEGGKVQIDDRTNMIVIRDLRKNLEDVKALVARLDTATPQVLIEARIVEVDTSFSRELGVQWGGSWNTGGATKVGISGIQDSTGAIIAGQPVTNSGTSPFSSTAPPPNFAVNLPATVGLGAGGGISFGILRDNLRLDLSLSALEASGKGRVISSPKVVTIDNKEAAIEQGTQIPYSTVSASGTNTQFVDATLSLKVTPNITPDGSVVMKLEAKNDSQGDVGVTGQPAINKKKATTEVLIRDGETAVIGGILQISRKENQAAVPWLSKIPILGLLFRKDVSSSTNRELLIFVTPKILKQEPAQAKSY